MIELTSELNGFQNRLSRKKKAFPTERLVSNFISPLKQLAETLDFMRLYGHLRLSRLDFLSETALRCVHR
jgi:hypothetical protein